jgi:hypothetical protein
VQTALAGRRLAGLVPSDSLAPVPVGEKTGETV